MRIDQSTPGFETYTIYLDGNPEPSATSADDVEGWVVCSFDSDGEQAQETKYGSVLIQQGPAQ